LGIHEYRGDAKGLLQLKWLQKWEQESEESKRRRGPQGEGRPTTNMLLALTSPGVDGICWGQGFLVCIVSTPGELNLLETF
jgi:hypothetical protein